LISREFLFPKFRKKILPESLLESYMQAESSASQTFCFRKLKISHVAVSRFALKKTPLIFDLPNSGDF
jgi:hypothetical protein